MADNIDNRYDFSQYNTESYLDAIEKAQMYYKEEYFNGLSYELWLKIIKKIIDNESTYTSGFKPSPEQYRALLTLAKRVLLDACPGSGKTATLIFRIFLDGVIFKYKPDQQLAITYTNAAAEEMKSRYRKICKRYNTYPGANISTIHSYARSIETQLSDLDVLDPGGMTVLVKKEQEESEEGDSLGYLGENDMLAGMIDELDDFEDETEEYEEVFISNSIFIKEAIEKLKLSQSYYKYLGSIEGWISTIIEKDIKTQEEFMNIVEFSNLDDVFVDDLINIHYYTKELRYKYNVMDFSDMLVGLYDRLVKLNTLDDIESNLIKNLLKLDVIYVDEYQDISPLQFKIISELLRLNPKARLFAVGDADQAIYSFRGSYTGFLVNFKEYFTKKEDWKKDEYSGMIDSNETNLKYGLGSINREDLGQKGSGDRNSIYKYVDKEEKDISKNVMRDYMKSLKWGDEEKEDIDIESIKESQETVETKPTYEYLVGEDEIDIIYFTINRRCTDKIIDFANNLIVYNNKRYPKVMKPIREGERKVELRLLDKNDDYNEMIIQDLKEKMKDKDANLSNNAVIYREHRQASQLAIDMLVNNIPLKAKLGLIPVRATETKDLLGIMNMIVNSKNTRYIEYYLYKVCRSVNKNKAKYISNEMIRTGKPFSVFLPDTEGARMDVNILRKAYLNLTKGNDLNKTIDILADCYDRHFRRYFSKDISKISDAAYYLKSLKAENYLDLVQKHETVLGNIYTYSNSLYGVTLTTMHSAKGLEFDNVYILPLDDQFMHKSTIIKKMESINKNYISEYEEEERRLLYVAITRAKNNLQIYLNNTTEYFCNEIYQIYNNSMAWNQ